MPVTEAPADRAAAPNGPYIATGTHRIRVKTRHPRGCPDTDEANQGATAYIGDCTVLVELIKNDSRRREIVTGRLVLDSATRPATMHPPQS
jgi:hypothetical protein